MENSENYVILGGKGHPDKMDAYVRMKLWFFNLENVTIIKGEDDLYYIVQIKPLME